MKSCDPTKHESGNASGKHLLLSIILLCPRREKRSEITVFIPGRLEGNLENEPAKERDPVFTIP